MYESQYQAQLLRIQDLHRAADEERRARSAAGRRRQPRSGHDSEGRVRRYTSRLTKAA